MILKKGSFYGMARDITKSESKIVIFGCGVVGSTITPEILKDYEIDDRVVCYVDNDKLRWDTSIEIFDREIKIFPPSKIKELDGNITVLISASRYAGIYDQLKTICREDRYSCYVIPMLCIENFQVDGGKGVIKTSTKQLIPKKIHYAWFGGKPIPDGLQLCIDSWKRYCPDYEIIRWDESNYDVHKNQFVHQAYANRKYAFVPDFARFEILYEYGGIYLDTDVLLKRNLDELLYQEAFCGVEKWQVINPGGCCGAVKGHESLKAYIQAWSNRSMYRLDGTVDNSSSGRIDTAVAIKNGYKINGLTQNVLGMNIYSYDYFQPYDYMSGKTEITSDTFSVHQYNGSWLDEKAKSDNEKATEMYEKMIALAINVG